MEEEGWATCYPDGSGLDGKAARAYTRKCHLGFHEDKSDSECLGTSATDDGELSSIAQALEGAREAEMLALLTDSKPVISALRKMDTGVAPKIRDRGLELCNRTHKDTCVAWVKGHKGIKSNEEADKLCREASIVGHESEGVVTPAGLRAWSKRVRAEERGHWGGTVGQYQPTPNVLQRKGHSGGGSTG